MHGLLCSLLFILVNLCANVGPQGLLVVRLPTLFIPHSFSLSPSTATGVLSALVPISAPPTGLDVCFFFISLVRTSLLFDFLSVLVVRGGAVCLPTLPSWFSNSDLLLPVKVQPIGIGLLYQLGKLAKKVQSP